MAYTETNRVEPTSDVVTEERPSGVGPALAAALAAAVWIAVTGNQWVIDRLVDHRDNRFVLFVLDLFGPFSWRVTRRPATQTLVASYVRNGAAVVLTFVLVWAVVRVVRRRGAGFGTFLAGLGMTMLAFGAAVVIGLLYLRLFQKDIALTYQPFGIYEWLRSGFASGAATGAGAGLLVGLVAALVHAATSGPRREPVVVPVATDETSAETTPTTTLPPPPPPSPPVAPQPAP
jgi:hypothetical protein